MSDVACRSDNTSKDSGYLLRIAFGLATLVVVCLAGGRVIATSDVTLYQQYAHSMVHGPLSAGLPKEYPALAGVLFLGVAWLPVSYLFGFAVCMACCLGLLLVWGFYSLEDKVWADRLLLYLAAGTATVILFRFDLLPASCAFVAVVYARRERFGRAWFAAVVGAALKFFPGLLLPGFFIYEWRRSGRPPWRRAAIAGGATLLLAAVQSFIAPGTLWAPIRYEAHRGFEFSSVPGSLTLLLGRGHVTWHFAFGNWQVLGPAHSVIAAILTATELGGLVAVWWFLARGRLGVDAASLAVLSVAVLTDRALAPQYLIWLAPLWALWPVRRSWLAACVLTFLTFPVAIGLHSIDGVSVMLPTFVGAIRNVVLVAGTLAWLVDELRAQSISPQLQLKPSPNRAPVAVEPSTRVGARCIVGSGSTGL